MSRPRQIQRKDRAVSDRPVCVFPGCTKGPTDEDGCYLERVNPKGEPFEGACPDHYWAVVHDEIPETPDDH